MIPAIPVRLEASAFPEATPLHAFFAWNEARRTRDRRYIVACDIARLLHGFGDDFCAAHLAGAPLGLRRRGQRVLASPAAAGRAHELVAASTGSAAMTAGRQVIAALGAAIGARDPAAHAAVFRAFEALARQVDLDDLARLRAPRQRPGPSRPQRILVIKLGALGDFIQALGPVPAIRSHHAGDRLTLLTAGRYAELAAQTGLFDEILVDPRPRPLAVRGWLALRRMLRRQHFDRVYDFQTSDRSNFYCWLLRPGPTPQWSGIAWRCSHPHANRGRDRQHTMDRQAEQLLMAGIHPVPLTPWLPPLAGALPAALERRRFAMLIPGSSPGHPEKRWPVARYGELARLLWERGYLPVVVGAGGEQQLGRAICAACPTSLDLTGRTDVAALAALAREAALTVGNDTGATHVAAAAGNPVVVLFSGTSNPDLCAPRGARVRVLARPDLADLAVEAVLATLALDGAPEGAPVGRCARRRSEAG